MEDEDRVRQLSVQLLRDLDCTVIQASDAKHALALLESQRMFNLLFTDIVMPYRNGKQLADHQGLRPG